MKIYFSSSWEGALYLMHFTLPDRGVGYKPTEQIETQHLIPLILLVYFSKTFF